MSSVAVIGAGAWGTALAIQAARAGNSVTLWARDPARAAAIAASRENPRLPGIRLPEPIAVSSELPDAADLALLAVPTQHLRGVLGRLPPGLAPLVVCAKGVEQADAAPAAGDRRRDPPGDASRRSHRAELRPRDRRRTARRRGRRRRRRRPARDGRRAARHALVPAVRQRRPDRRPGRRCGEERDRHRGRRGDRRRARRERPRRADHPRPGGAGAARRGARRTGGDGDGAVGARRSAADLHRRGEPQLQPRAGAGPRRDAGRRAGRPQSRSPRAWPRRPPWWRAPKVWTCRSASRSRRCWQDARRWPRRSPPCWPARGATNDPRRPDRRRLDHGQPHPGLRARHADRGDAGRRPDRRRLLRRAEAAQPVPPPVRRGRVQRRLRPRLLRHARRRGPPGGAPVRRRDVRRHGVLARRADHRRRGVHAADDGGAGAGLRRHAGEVRARGGRCRGSRSPICC